uniref:Uncharacterized protein n=1 Tax=Tanacetum cinerariifolium TaxID=118510 RepID=A0A699U0Y7_TANCI|nr:hypothetical protein [Tanacetum cinerariifolium]
MPNAGKSVTVRGPLASSMTDLEVAYRVLAQPDPNNYPSSEFSPPRALTGPRNKVLGNQHPVAPPRTTRPRHDYPSGRCIRSQDLSLRAHACQQDPYECSKTNLCHRLPARSTCPQHHHGTPGLPLQKAPRSHYCHAHDTQRRLAN